MHLCRCSDIISYKKKEHKSLETSLQSRMTNGDRSMMMRPLICNGLTCPDVILLARLFTPVGVSLTFNLHDALALNSRSKYNGSRRTTCYAVYLGFFGPSSASQFIYAKVL